MLLLKLCLYKFRLLSKSPVHKSFQNPSPCLFVLCTCLFLQRNVSENCWLLTNNGEASWNLLLNKTSINTLVKHMLYINEHLCWNMDGTLYRFYIFLNNKYIYKNILMYLCIHKDCSAMSDSLQPHGLEPARLLFSWNFSSKNSRVGCHFQLQGIFPTQGWNLGLL